MHATAETSKAARSFTPAPKTSPTLPSIAIDGTIYKWVRVVECRADSVSIEHSEGIAQLPLSKTSESQLRDLASTNPKVKIPLSSKGEHVDKKHEATLGIQAPPPSKPPVTPPSLSGFSLEGPDAENWWGSYSGYKALWKAHEDETKANANEESQRLERREKEKQHQNRLDSLREELKDSEAHIAESKKQARRGAEAKKDEFEKAEDFKRRSVVEDEAMRRRMAESIASEERNLERIQQRLKEASSEIMPIPVVRAPNALPSKATVFVRVDMQDYDADTERCKSFALVSPETVFQDGSTLCVFTPEGTIGPASIPLSVAKLLRDPGSEVWAAVEADVNSIFFENTWISAEAKRANRTAFMADAANGAKAVAGGILTFIAARLLGADDPGALTGETTYGIYEKDAPTEMLTEPVDARVIHIKWNGSGRPFKLFKTPRGTRYFHLVWSAVAN